MSPSLFRSRVFINSIIILAAFSAAVILYSIIQTPVKTSEIIPLIVLWGAFVYLSYSRPPKKISPLLSFIIYLSGGVIYLVISHLL